MISIKTLLLEKMTERDARKIFGYKSTDRLDAEDVKKRWRELVKVHHTDRGGSQTNIADVNAAHDILKTIAVNYTKSSSSGNVDSDPFRESDKKYAFVGEAVLADIENKFKPDVFVDYFKSIFNTDFSYKLKSKIPEKGKKYYSVPTNVSLAYEFFDVNRDTVFQLGFHVDLTPIVYPRQEGGALSGAGKNFEMYIDAYGFHNNRKQKLHSRDWKFYDTSKVFDDPEVVFPKAKMKKIASGATSKGAFSKRDMESYLKVKLHANVEKDYTSIPLADDYKLVIYRMIFRMHGQKTVTWGVNGLYKKHRRISMMPTTSIPENLKSAQFFENVQKQVKNITDEAKLIDALTDIFKKVRNDKSLWEIQKQELRSKLSENIHETD